MLNAYDSEQFSKGVFYSDAFSVSNYIKQLSNKMLNEDAEIVTFEEFANANLNPI